MSAEIDFPTRRARPHVEPRGGAGALGHDSAVGSRFPLQHTTVTENTVSAIGYVSSPARVSPAVSLRGPR